MEALKELVFNHRFTINKMRTNVNDDIGYFRRKKKQCLIKGASSNTVKKRTMLEIVQEMLPEAGITELCLKKTSFAVHIEIRRITVRLIFCF